MIEKKKIKFGNSDIFYKVSGSGNPVVLLHGFAEDGNIWKHQLEFLNGHFRLIIPDTPGSGNSSILHGDASIDAYAEVLKAILTKEEIYCSTLIGHSMGGYIALAFAERYPNELNGIGLVHSTSYPDDDATKIMRQKGIRFIEKHGSFAFLKRVIPNLFNVQFKKNHPEEINVLLEAASDFSKESLQQHYMAMMQRPDRKVILQTFHKPILFIMGKEDKTLNLQDILAESHQPWQSHVYILKNTAHMGMWEEKEKCNQILLSYLRHVNEN